MARSRGEKELITDTKAGKEAPNRRNTDEPVHVNPVEYKDRMENPWKK